MRTQFLVLAFIHICNPSVVIFWGIPVNGTSQCNKSTSTGSFDDCADKCVNSTDCMLAYGSDDSCMLCDVYSVRRINQTDRTAGIKTAMKINDGTVCPFVMESSSFQRTNTSDNYNMTFSSGTWSISYEKKFCPDTTWSMFNRTKGEYCLKMSVSSTPINRTYAASMCKSNGYELAGGFSLREMAYIKRSLNNLTASQPYDTTGAWLDGLRKPTCNTTGCEKLAACQNRTAFSFSYTFSDDLRNFAFVTGQPNSTTDRGMIPECLAYIGQNMAKKYYFGGWYNTRCDFGCSADKTICMTTYVCGTFAV